MDKKGVKLERYGHLNKTERLTTLTSNIIQGTLVLEAPEPFPGSLSYYGEIPRLPTPLYVYLVLDKFPDLELVARATEQVHETFPWEFSAACACVVINFEKYHTIRVRNLLSLEQITALQNEYIKAGVTMKKKGHTLEGNARLELKKLFQLMAYPNNVYMDYDEKDQGYFEVPENLSVDDFEALIRKVKNNTHFQSFDFAQVFFYTNNKIIDLIRVYHPELNVKIVSEVKDAVLSRFSSVPVT